jgi:hypothetical protein
MSNCAIIELRQYTLHPGAREVLIELFDGEFVESQEALGMHVVGQFRDLDDPNRFVWLRGFADMDSRYRALAGFYGGPVWAAHRDRANATMVDFDDVLLLRPVVPGPTLPLDGTRPPAGETVVPRSLVVATVYRLPGPITDEVLTLVTGPVEQLLTRAGAPALAFLQTEAAPNTYSALPVREEFVLVRLSRFPDVDGHAAFLRRLAALPGWKDVQRELAAHLLAPPQDLRLHPTARSLLR